MTRYYEKDGLKLPSVTTIIKECTNNSAPLVQWAVNETLKEVWAEYGHYTFTTEYSNWFKDEVFYDQFKYYHKELKQEAADIGTEVHIWIEQYLLPRPVKTLLTDNPNIMTALTAFKRFRSDHKLEPIALEQTVHGNGWAGTLDFYGKIDGKLAIIDWKTSKGHYPDSHGPQIAAYGSVLDDLPERYMVVRLDKSTGEYDMKDYTRHIKKYLNIWDHMLRLYMAKHPIIAKRAGYDPNK